MEPFELNAILESLLFVSNGPMRLDAILEALPELTREEMLAAIDRLQQGMVGDESRGIELVAVAGGYQFRTKPRLAVWHGRLRKTRTVKMSQSALETLAIVAYRQPVIRPEIEEVRGVDSGHVLRSLLEKGFVRILGRKDIPGRPIIYGTTKTFLEVFGLGSLADLPTLKEVKPPQEGALLKAETEAVPLDEPLNEGTVEAAGLARVLGELEKRGGGELENQTPAEETAGETVVPEAAGDLLEGSSPLLPEGSGAGVTAEWPEEAGSGQAAVLPGASGEGVGTGEEIAEPAAAQGAGEKGSSAPDGPAPDDPAV
jgi:segregation and condensation protein B